MVLALGLAAVLLPFFALCAYVFPTADDMCFTGLAARAGQIKAFTDYYLGWGGRVLPTLVLDALGIPIRLFGFEFYYGLYKVVVAAFIASLGGSLALAARSVTGGALRRSDSLAMGGLFLATLLAAMPSLGEFYHLPFLTTYHLGGVIMVLLTVALAAPLATGRMEARRHPWRLGLACILGGLAATSCEATSLALCMVAAFGVAGSWRQGESSGATWRRLFLAVLLGAAVSLGSPGNTHRMSYLSERNELLTLPEIVTKAPRYAIKDALAWLWRPEVIAFPLVALGLGFLRGRDVDPRGRLRPRHLALLPTLTLLYLILYQLPSLWAIGFPPAPRIMNTALAVGLLGGAASTFLAGVVLHHRMGGTAFATPFRRVLPACLGLMALAVLAFCLASDNYRTAWHDLRGPAEAFAAQMRERNARIDAAIAAGEQHIRLDPLQGPLPSTVHFPDQFPWNPNIKEDPTADMNLCFARAYGVETMVVAPAPPHRTAHSAPDGGK